MLRRRAGHRYPRTKLKVSIKFPLFDYKVFYIDTDSFDGLSH